MILFLHQSKNKKRKKKKKKAKKNRAEKQAEEIKQKTTAAMLGHRLKKKDPDVQVE